jgi:hypothetical protein
MIIKILMIVYTEFERKIPKKEISKNTMLILIKIKPIFLNSVL